MLGQASRIRQELRALVDETSQRPLAAWGTVQIGNSAYEELSRRHADLDNASLEAMSAESRQAYDRVISAYGDVGGAVAQAHFGLGKLAENAGNFEEARGQYKAIVDMGSPKADALTVSRAQTRLMEMEKWTTPVVFPASARRNRARPCRWKACRPVKGPKAGYWQRLRPRARQRLSNCSPVWRGELYGVCRGRGCRPCNLAAGAFQ